jgi:hypothetical protein
MIIAGLLENEIIVDPHSCVRWLSDRSVTSPSIDSVAQVIDGY